MLRHCEKRCWPLDLILLLFWCSPSFAGKLPINDAMRLFQVVDSAYKDVDAIWPKGKLPEFLHGIERACLDLLQSSPPEGISDADWSHIMVRTQRALGWVKMQLRDPAGELELTKALKLSPDDPEIAYWLGTVLAYKHVWSMAVYYLARAASLEGPNQFPEYRKSTILQYARRIYESRGGAAGGFDRMVATAKNHPFPPDRFDISP